MMVETINSPPAASPAGNAAKRVLHNIVALGIAQLCTWASRGVLLVVLPYYLSAADMGRFATVAFVMTFIRLATEVGMSNYVVQETARASSAVASRLAFNAMAVRLPLTASGLILATILVELIVDSPTVKAIFYVSLPGLALEALYGSLAASLRGLQEMRPIAVSSAMGRVLYVVIVVLLLVSGHGVVELAAASAVGPLVGIVVATPALLRRSGLDLRLDLRLCGAIVVGSIPFFVWQASMQIYQHVDLLILAQLTSATVVGWYSVAYRLMGIPVFFPTIVTAALFPALSQATKRDPDAIRTLSWSALKAVLFVTLPLSLGTAVLSQGIIDSLQYPAEYGPSVPLLSIVSLQMPPAALGMVVGTCLYALDKHWAWVRVAIIAALLNPAANLVCIPLTDAAYQNGAIGASIVTVLTETFMLAWGIWLLPRSFLDRHNCIAMLRICLSGILMIPVVWLLRDAGTIFVPVVAGGLVYFSAALFLDVLPVEELRTVLRRRTHADRSLAEAPPTSDS